MSRTSKIVVALLALALVAGLGASAQALPSAGNTDARLFSLDLGMVTGYSLNTEAAVVGRTFGINFTVTDNMAVGYANTVAGTREYNLFRLGYYLLPIVGFNVYVGSDGSVATGAGVFVNVLKTKSAPALTSSLKLKLEYLFATAGAGSGDIVFAVASSIGL